MNEFTKQYAALVARYVDPDELENFHEDFEEVLNAYYDEYTDDDEDEPDEEADEGTDDWAGIVKTVSAAKQNQSAKGNRRDATFDEAVKVVRDLIRLVKEA
ncbi:MAG: hypothetical protein IJ774_05805 [Selenomonadaceae bacterium]|nr:hypothetical protein [Selenomonadaceae bacterium]MBR1805890.1 hypothetical protein [Selenomonadaceae bacterium]